MKKKDDVLGLDGSERLYRTLYKNALVGLFRSSIVEGNLLAINQRCAEIIGYKTIEKCLKEYIPANSYADLNSRIYIFEMLYKYGEVNDYEVQLKGRYGNIVWINISAKIYPDENCIEGVLIDVTSKKRAEADLKKSEIELNSIMNSVPDIIYRIDPDGKIIFINNAVKKYGYLPSDLIGKDIFDFVYPRDIRKALYRINERRTGDRRTKDFELRFMTLNNALVDLEFNASAGEHVFLLEAHGIYRESGEEKIFIGTQGVARDITQRKKTEVEKLELEEKLIQAQKMESIGTLAGGIAHDFNNILSSIIGYTQLSVRNIKDHEKLEKYLRRIRVASNRATSLVRQILLFSRQKTSDKKELIIGITLKEVLDLLRASLPLMIKINKLLPSEHIFVNADRIQIHQVLMNLFTNASHAMGKKGEMTISLSAEDINDYKASELCILRGRYAKIVVSDTGSGIDNVALDKIFDPYYTTKDVGEGTGLGLSVAQGIIKDHDGAISVKSELGKGSVFSVYLPSIKGSEREFIKEEIEYPTGIEKIFCIDDEDDLGYILKEHLDLLGYSVTVSNDPKKVLSCIDTLGEFDLIITDRMMPNVAGEDLAFEIKKIYPSIPIIICTGDAVFAYNKKPSDFGVEGIIIKPITEKMIAFAVREALDKLK